MSTYSVPGGYRRTVVQTTRYRYVGPAEIRDRAIAEDVVTLDSVASLDRWLTGHHRREVDGPFTFVVALNGVLRLALRGCEHIAVAGGQDVLAAGEMTFGHAGSGWRVVEVSNQSTGYCPDPNCWPAVASALDRVGVSHPGGFTDQVIFRRCPRCGERNIVRDDDFTCALCDSSLPTQWNFTST